MFRMFRTLRNAVMTNTPDVTILHWVTKVLVRNYTGSPHWLPGIVKTVLRDQYYTRLNSRMEGVEETPGSTVTRSVTSN